MFFTVSKGVKELAASMIENPHDWVQGQYEFVNTKHQDIRIWTCSGVTFLKIGGNDCLSLAEKFYLANAIKRATAQKTSDAQRKLEREVMTMNVCPVCCKPLKRTILVAFCDDDNGAHRFVGADCWRRIRLAGAAGYKQADDIGSRWYTDQLAAITSRSNV